jgi:Tfp pilus assembly protein PilF
MIVKNYLGGILIVILVVIAANFSFTTKAKILEKKYPADTFFKTGLIYLYQDSLYAAGMSFKNALLYQPNFAYFHYYLAVVFQKQGRYQEAIHEYLKAANIDHECFPALYNLGMIYAENGQHDQAIVYLREALKIDPYNPDAYKELAQVYIEKGDTLSAARIYEHLRRAYLR